MQNSQVFDVETLLKVGVTNPNSQHMIANMMNQWIPILAQDRIDSLKEFIVAIRHKVEQNDHLLHENQELLKRVPSTDINKIAHLEATIKARDAEIAQLKTKRPRTSATPQTEQRALAESLETKTTECIALQREITKLKSDIQKMQKEAESKNAEFQGRYSTVHTQAKKQIDEKEAQCAMAISISKQATGILKSFVSAYAEANMILSGMQSNLQSQKKLQDRLIRGMSAFFDTTTSAYMICPIPTRSGDLVPFRTIVTEWINNPLDFNGEIHATFRCSITNGDNSIASAEQVSLIRRLAKDLGISLKSPITVSIKQNDEPFTQLPFYEQLRIASCLCKLYRERNQEPEETVLLYKGQRFIRLKISKGGNPQASKFKVCCEFGAKSSGAGHVALQAHQIQLTADHTIFTEFTFQSRS